MRKIHLGFVLGKAIGKSVLAAFPKPMPLLQIVADGESPVSKTALLQMKGQLLALRIFHTKGPIKPIAVRVAQFVFQKHVVIRLINHGYVSTDKILRNPYHF